MATAIPTPTPTLSIDSSGILNDLLSPSAIAGIAISAAITITVLAVLCWCCCCRHHSSKRFQDRESSISRLQSPTPTSELGLVQEPASMLEIDTTGQGLVIEEPPPAYYTLEHRTQPPLPVEMGVGARRGWEAEIGAGMEAWNGFQMVSEISPGTNPRMISREVPVAGPATARNMTLQVNTGVNPFVHATDENVGEGEEEGLSRSITYSAYSVREPAIGTVAMPSVVSREGTRDQGKL